MPPTSIYKIANVKKISFFCLCLIVLISGGSYGQDGPNIEFVENKGQWDNKVKFKGEMNAGAFFLTSKGFTAVKHNAEDWAAFTELNHPKDGMMSNTRTPEGPGVVSPSALTIRSHAYNVSFINAAQAEIAGEGGSKAYNNYFLGDDRSKWATNCRIYKTVVYKNIYPNVDVRYYTGSGHLKYDIIVRPGAKIDNIALRYEGVDGLQLNNQELTIKTSVGDIKELAPYTYQVENGRQKQVACSFKVSGDVVRFETGSYSKNATLVIDPTVVFSTFTGSTADNWGYTATYGPDGSFFAAGIVFGNGYPTSTGAYQTSYNGGFSEGFLPGHDIGIIKFNSVGTQREYATYLGGNGNEQPNSLVSDGQGNLVIAGATSSGNFPFTAAAFGVLGGYDIFLTKLNSSGTAILGSRRIGGNGVDGINILPKTQGNGAISVRRNYGDDARCEVILDNDNNIYLASCTQSVNFPTTVNAFQQANGSTSSGRNQDAVLIKTTPDIGAILFSSFLGGNGDDAAFVLALHPKSKNIYVGGSTGSVNFPGRNNGPAINLNYQGGECDGFVSIISNDGSTLIQSTYIGTAGNDMLYGLSIDQSGFPYITGTTTGSFPVINAAFSQGGGKQFVSKLKADLSGYEYSTNFGTNATVPNLSTTAFLVDACERVYVSGWGGLTGGGSVNSYPNASTNGLTVTPDAIKSSTDGSDFYFIVLEQNASSLLYGSFFGQTGGFADHVDGGSSRFNKDGTLYQGVCANCQRGTTFPTTPGAWAETNGSNSCNQAAVKVAFNLCNKGFSTNYWVGTTDDSWHNPLNWSTGIVPNEYVDVIINPGSPFSCVITEPAICRTLTIVEGGNLTANNNLTVKH